MAARHKHPLWIIVAALGLLLGAIGAPAHASPYTGEIIWSEDFESGWGDWYCDNGVWQVGSLDNGRCLAETVLDDYYPATQDSRLISPTITLPTIAGPEKIELRFRHWFSYGWGDTGTVQVSVYDSGSWSTWNDLATINGNAGTWSPMHIDLTAWAAKQVRIGFLHAAQRNQYNHASESWGWCVDDVAIWKGVPAFWNPETFEFGWGDWYCDNGVWQVGHYLGDASVVGTVMDEHYPAYQGSRLISPPITLPPSAGPDGVELRFEHWFSYSWGDSGTVQVSVYDSGSWSTWNDLATIDGNAGAWSPMRIDLTAWAGKQARIGFLHTAQRNQYNHASESWGWYIDNVQITPPPETWWVSEDTGISRTDKLTHDTTPELTFVFPHAVHGNDTDINVIDPDGIYVVPDSIAGWGTNTVAANITTPLTKDGQYVVLLMGTITDSQGQRINNGSIKILDFTLDTTPPIVTADIVVAADATMLLTGTVNDPNAKVDVIVDESTFAARTHNDGTWVLPEAMIDATSPGGIGDWVVAATDAAGNVGTTSLMAEPCTLTLSSTEGGSILEPGEGAFSYGVETVESVTAEAEIGYRFVRWEGTAWDNDLVTIVDRDDFGSTVEVYVDGVHTLIAVFEPLCSLTLATIGQGAIDPDGGSHYYVCGQTEHVAAVADAGFRFCRWEGTALDAGKIVIEELTDVQSVVMVTIDGSYTLTAVFEEIVYAFPMDHNPGWALEGQWEFGVPTGQRCGAWGNNDPIGGYTGQNVLGVNLDGCYNAKIGGPYYATAGPFDLSGYENVTLRFWRWLNCDIPEYVRSTVEVSTDGQHWTVVWTQAEREEISEEQWTLCEYPLPQAHSQSTVYVRWGYEIIRERAYAYTGWNIDDVQLIGRLGCN